MTWSIRPSSGSSQEVGDGKDEGEAKEGEDSPSTLAADQMEVASSLGPI